MRLNDRGDFEVRRTHGDLVDLELAKTFARRGIKYTPCLGRLNHVSGFLRACLNAFLYGNTAPQTTTVQQLGVVAVQYHAPFTVSFDRNQLVLELTTSIVYTVQADKVGN